MLKLANLLMVEGIANQMDIDNLKEALAYLKEYYLASKMENKKPMYGFGNLNSVIVKLQGDIEAEELKK